MELKESNLGHTFSMFPKNSPRFYRHAHQMDQQWQLNTTYLEKLLSLETPSAFKFCTKIEIIRPPKQSS